MHDDFLWSEKYRPKTIKDCILPERIKNTFTELVSSKNLPNFMFCGTAGIGKTTIAKALCSELNAEYLFINGSDESGIDVLRTKIKSFASSVSLQESSIPKIVILDEADYLTPAMQAGLRAFIEDYSDNCRFILTCNFKNKIIEPLHSRCTPIDFTINKDETPPISGMFLKRICFILKQEGINYNGIKPLADIVKKHFPDFRRTINEIQRYCSSGAFVVDQSSYSKDESFQALYGIFQSQDFRALRNWVGTQPILDSESLFHELFKNADHFVLEESVPSLIIILSDYQYKAAFAADAELNIMACLTEIMGTCKFKGAS